MNLAIKLLPDPEAAIFIRAQNAGRFRLRHFRLGSILAQDGLAVAPSSDEDLKRGTQSFQFNTRLHYDLITTTVLLCTVIEPKLVVQAGL